MRRPGATLPEQAPELSPVIYVTCLHASIIGYRNAWRDWLRMGDRMISGLLRLELRMLLVLALVIVSLLEFGLH
jgi:hypothetical protein